MGNCGSLPISLDEVNRLIGILCRKGYIGNLEKNLKDLEREMEDLRASQDGLKNKVAREEAQQRQKLKTVQVWLERVENISTRVEGTLSTSSVQLQKLCLCGFCSKNVCLSYKYGKSVFVLLEEVKKLKLEGADFKEVTELIPLTEVVERPTRRTVGQDTMLETAWNRLMDANVGIMGLHGMGGVGKTTLFKKIHNKFTDIAGEFGGIVIWVVVSQGATISKLQEDIAQKLNLFGSEWTKKSESDKAAEMHRVLKGKKFVLMLDDIWEKVDLEALGVPEPTRENGCKVTFTTRSEDVCKRMGDHEPMQVKCLEEDQAWELFKLKIGDEVLRRDPRIEGLARKVAEKCHGLPLALSVIGETMASKTMVQEWHEAIDVLTRNAAEFSEMEDKILPLLKYSYDNLKNEQIKSCFLYCALFPEDYKIGKERLIDYWICEGFMGEYQDLRRAVNKGYGVLSTLIRANLLTNVGTERVVMHDVVREMALWIASDLGENKENFVVQAGVGLEEVPKVKDWGAVRRMSLMRNEIKEMTFGSKCSQLTTLFLRSNNLKNFSGEIIQYIQKLVVLDLSWNRKISALPEQISELTSLQYLDLSLTHIEKLPVGFQELKKLTHLNLTSTFRLRSISGISKLSSLTSLKLFNSNLRGDVNLVKELQLLEHLQVLTITVYTELGLEQILGDQRLVNCIYRLHIHDFQEKPLNLSLLMSMENLRELGLTGVHVDSSALHNPTRPCFANLSNVYIYDCKGIKDLTWLLFAPNLVGLSISDSEELEEVINKEKATKLTGFSPFEKLEELYLQELPRLESIYWSPLPFPLLRLIQIEDCPKLRKLPLNATSVSRVDELLIYIRPREQQTELEWEDEDTKNRFLPAIFKFEINHVKDEHLESVEGYYDHESGYIQGLQFKTNFRVSELIGYERGYKFTLEVTGKKICGFHGYMRKRNIISLGAYFTMILPSTMDVKGGKGGHRWDDGANHDDVTKIHVRGGSEGIQYTKFNYVKDGEIQDGPIHGSSGSGFTQMFEINHFDDEHLVYVEGYYDEASGVIQALQFKTNLKTSDVLGYEKGKKFLLADKGKKIIGFHGYADKNLNSLGAYFTTVSLTKSERHGGYEGIYWDDGVFECIRTVYVSYDTCKI